MTEQERLDFEGRLERRLIRYAAIDVAPVDADAIAAHAMRRRSSGTVWVLLAAALLGVLLLGTWLLSGGSPRRPDLTGVVPTAVPSATDAQAPGSETPVTDALRAQWTAVATPNSILGTAGGPVDLTVDQRGTGLGVNNFGPGLAFQSTVSQDGPDQLHLVLEGTSGDCPDGARGTYRWALSGDRSIVTLTLVSDDCPNRGIVLGRSWGRSLAGMTSVGAGFVTTMGTPFAVTLPDARLQARTLDDFIEIGDPAGFSLMVFKNPQGFGSACSQAQRYPYAPGADAFIDYVRQNDAFDVLESTPMEVDGHHAVHLVTVARTDYAPCPNPPDGFMFWTPKGCDCHFVTGPGGRDSLYLVDVGADTFMFEISPVSPTGDTSNEPPIIDSIRIPVALPTQ